MSEKISETTKVTNPNTMEFEFAGVNVSIGKILGDKLVEEMMTRISPEEIELLFKYMHDETWSKDYKDEPILKYTAPNGWSSPEPPKLATYARVLLADRLKEAIQIKVEEIVKSEEFIKKADDIAEELVEYATNGYKEDMKQRLKNRLVGNVINSEPTYCGESLSYIVSKIVSEMIRL